MLRLGVVLLFFVGVGGWIANIVKLVAVFGDPITTMAVARLVGIFVAPIGAVLGYL